MTEAEKHAELERLKALYKQVLSKFRHLGQMEKFMSTKQVMLNMRGCKIVLSLYLI